MKTYKELQIIKHALAYYLTRPNITEKERNTETILLGYYIEKVERLKEQYHLK